MVILLNCSFRGPGSNTNHFLDLLEAQLGEWCERVQLNQIEDLAGFGAKLESAQVLVLGTPLYVDSLPAQAVTFLEEMYRGWRGKPGQLQVYVVSNLGFYESRQIALQLEIVRHWCERMGVSYGGALAIGAGEMLGGLGNIPLDQGPNRELGKGIRALAQAIAGRRQAGDIYVEPSGFPRVLYKAAADRSWEKRAKKNGLTKKELFGSCKDDGRKTI